LPDAADDEDVVVRAERDQEHARGEGDVVREVVVAEEDLEDVGGQAERRGHGEEARGEEVKRRDERPQEEREEHDVDRQHHRSDALRAPDDGLDGVACDGGLAENGGLDLVQPRCLEDPGQPLVETVEVLDRGRAERARVEDDREAGGRPEGCRAR
jgi:hypothetical protein